MVFWSEKPSVFAGRGRAADDVIFTCVLVRRGVCKSLGCAAVCVLLDVLILGLVVIVGSVGRRVKYRDEPVTLSKAVTCFSCLDPARARR